MSEEKVKQSEVVKVDRKSVHFYGCGGTGINIVSDYLNTVGHDNRALRAMETFSYFDTSVANLHGIAANQAYLCEDSQGRRTDGGGSDRRMNAHIINDNMKPFLLKHPPKDLNVVVFNASGATGSTAGPLLIDHLLSTGATVVAIITVSVESQTAAENAFRTIQGLEAASNRLGRPIVFTYSATDSRRMSLDQANLYQLMSMEALSILGSGRNARIDGADVTNLFNFDRNTQVSPSLALLEIHQLKKESFDEIEDSHYLSSITVLKDEADKHPIVESVCSKIGYLRPQQDNSGVGYFYGVSLDNLNKKVISNLEHIRKEASNLGAVVPKVKSLMGDTPIEESGIGNLIL